MANSVMEELGYLALGAGLAEVTDYLTTNYADPQANLNFAALGPAGKPSVYLPAVVGAGGLGYALYQANKFKRLKDEELIAAGYGIYALIKTAGKLASPKTASASIRKVQTIQGRVIGSVGAERVGAGYPAAPGTVKRGQI